MFQSKVVLYAIIKILFLSRTHMTAKFTSRSRRGKIRRRRKRRKKEEEEEEEGED